VSVKTRKNKAMEITQWIAGRLDPLRQFNSFY